MPIHDWRRVISGIFHDFHQAWITEIRNALNDGLLPEGFYALAEQVAGGPHPDILALEEVDSDLESDSDTEWQTTESGFDGGGAAVAMAVAEHPPKLRFTVEAEAAMYVWKANRVAIHHRSGDRVVAFIEIVSPGNKQSEVAVRQLIDKLTNALVQGRHLLVIDLFPPGRHDPQGLHAELWCEPDPPMTAEEPLIQVAYRATASPVAYLEPTAVGQRLTDMPLFLTEGYYINVPLEATYTAAWKGVPTRWKRELEPPIHIKPDGPATTT